MSRTEFTKLKALTYVACTALIAVAIPATATAVTGSSTNITDPKTATYKARVDSSGRLSVNVGNKTVPVSGSVSARITGGTVDVGNVTPSSPLVEACSGENFSGTSITCGVGVQGGKRFAIQLISVRCGVPSTPNGVAAEVTFDDLTPNPQTIYIPPVQEGGGTTYAATQPVSLYASSAAAINITCRFGTTQDVTVDATVSGYVY